MMFTYSSKRYIRQIIGVVSILCIVIFLSWFVNYVFTLKQVEVTGDVVQIVVDKEKIGRNMLFLHTKQLEHDILSSYPLIDTVIFTKSFPSTLVVHVTLRQPSVYVLSQSHMYAVDGNGIVLSDAQKDALLPRLIFDVGVLAIGSHIPDARVIASIAFITGIRDSLSIDTMTEKDSTSLIAQYGNTSIVLPQKMNAKEKAGTLQTIVTGFKIKGELPAVIDLRFDKPIVTK